MTKQFCRTRATVAPRSSARTYGELRCCFWSVYVTDEPFNGNQLAVFTDPAGLSESQMQKIAKELNFSETTFVFPPGKKEEADFRVRIFTPELELPMAGHPTIGTAFVLSLQDRRPKSKLRFEEKVGIIPVSVEFEGGVPGWVSMSQPLPKFGPAFEDREGIRQDALS